MTVDQQTSEDGRMSVLPQVDLHIQCNLNHDPYKVFVWKWISLSLNLYKITKDLQQNNHVKE